MRRLAAGMHTAAEQGTQHGLSKHCMAVRASSKQLWCAGLDMRQLEAGVHLAAEQRV